MPLECMLHLKAGCYSRRSNVQELCSFLGLRNYYAKFISYLSTLIHSLNSNSSVVGGEPKPARQLFSQPKMRCPPTKFLLTMIQSFW